MASQVDIVNRALLGIGQRTQVSGISPSDGSVAANAAAVLFTPTFEALARTAPWNCLRKQATLTLLAAAVGTPENPTGGAMPVPPSPWLYSYALPSDCLYFRFIVPSFPSQPTGVPQTSYNNAATSVVPWGGGKIPYAVAYSNDANNNPSSIILTNQSQAQGVYTVNQPNPVIWDSLFQAAMVSSLSAYFVPALSLNMPLMAGAIQAAERMIAQARTSDGNEGDVVMDHTPDWILARSGGGGRGWGPGYFGGCNGWPNMSWP